MRIIFLIYKDYLRYISTQCEICQPLHTYVKCSLGSSKQSSLPLTFQGHKIYPQFALYQLVLEYHMLHSSLNAMDLDHSRRNLLCQRRGNISLDLQQVPTYKQTQHIQHDGYCIMSNNRMCKIIQ